MNKLCFKKVQINLEILWDLESGPPWNLLRMTCNTSMVRKFVYLYIWAFYPFQMPQVAIRFLLQRADRPLAVIESTECTCIYKMIQYIISLSTYIGCFKEKKIPAVLLPLVHAFSF